MNLSSLLFATCCSIACLLVCLLPGEDAGAAVGRPNILWITCEDMSLVLGCYGDPCAVTPNLDRLASQGVRYTNAFAAASVCSPARSCLITGVYPTSLGTQHLRSTLPLPDAIRCFPEFLREAGYYTTNNVKEDYQFETPAACWNDSSRQAHWRGREPGQPFFSVFNLITTHQSQIRLADKQFAERTARLTPDQRHDPATIALPPYYPDTPIVRRDVARFYDLVTAMDIQTADLLAQLDEDGLADDTIVFFYSDHGTGMPRHKRWLYDSGVQVPLIVRFPEKYRHLAPGAPGGTTDRLVSFVDFAPTVLSLTGLEIPGYMEGHAFLGPKAAEPREYVYAVRDRVDEVYETSRAVRDGRFKYIRNYMPHRPVIQYSDYSEQTPTRAEFRRLASEGNLTGPARRLMNDTKPPEELFDTQNDPHEINNLAYTAEHQQTLQRMREAHRRWMLETLDTGLLPEAEMYRRTAGGSPYEFVRQADYPHRRIVAAAQLVGQGPEACDELATRLADADSAVRYWAATGLAALGPDARPAADALTQALDDESPNVRLAAAEALVNVDGRPEAMQAITAALEDPDGWVRLHAATVLVALGPKARSAIDDIRKALDEKSKHKATNYTRWALARALSKLENPGGRSTAPAPHER